MPPILYRIFSVTPCVHCARGSKGWRPKSGLYCGCRAAVACSIDEPINLSYPTATLKKGIVIRVAVNLVIAKMYFSRATTKLHASFCPSFPFAQRRGPFATGIMNYKSVARYIGYKIFHLWHANQNIHYERFQADSYNSDSSARNESKGHPYYTLDIDIALSAEMEHRTFRIFANGETASFPLPGVCTGVAQSVPMVGLGISLWSTQSQINRATSRGRKYELYFDAANQYGLHRIVRNTGSPWMKLSTPTIVI